MSARTRTVPEQGMRSLEEDDVVRVPEDVRRTDWRRFVVPATVLVILAVAVIVRFIHLTALGFNSDEAVYSGQAGSLAGVGAFARSFSPFRAHPLLLQTVLALEYKALGHMSEFASRATVAVLGVVAVFATWRLGRRLYGVAVGLGAAAALAVMPYHVFLSRQVLLDVPAGLAVLLAFAALYRYEGLETRRWLYLAGALGGVACVIKETMIVFLPAAFVYLLWTGLLRKTRFRDALLAGVLMGMMLAPFIGTRFVFSGSEAGGYIIYQLFRDPNHPVWYFPVVFWIFITPVAVLSVVGGFVVCCVRRDRADKLLVSWVAVFGLFFQFWPTKLLPYAIILTPAMALIGARGVVAAVQAVRARRSVRVATIVGVVAAAAILVPMLRPTWKAGAVLRDSSFSGPFTTDVEVQDFAGGREVGTWLGRHTPSNAVVLTMGPSLGNLVNFYGDRDFYALSVSPDPKLRNPAYRPILNPDTEIRQMHVQYAVWDAYTNDRAPFYGQRLDSYVSKYAGTPVFSVWVEGNQVKTGRVAPSLAEVRIVVYQLVGGDPLHDAPAEVGR
ncbi:MAG: glycosyltransferase family 39 protein [Actinomycetota bacterium]